jgi:hypothetical protein
MEKNIRNSVLPEFAQNQPAVKANTPYRFWEIEEGFKCPVVGMCMTLTEQKRLMKKSKMALKGASPFEIHKAFGACSDNENPISRRVDRLLQRKFGKETEALFKLKPEAFLKNELEGLYECNKKQQRQIKALKEKNRSLASKLGCQGELNRRIRNEARSIIAELVAKNRCDQSCPSFDLCQKRILIVGGMSRMELLYRELIESSGGIFEYHDGYMKKGSRQLESRLRRADVVLCPVNCNSHNACSMVKRLAKKYQKPVQMLANSSLQAISRAIWGNGSNRQMVN